MAKTAIRKGKKHAAARPARASAREPARRPAHKAAPKTASRRPILTKKTITREVTSFLVACASEADPRTRVRKARSALSSMAAGNKRGQMALRALLAHAMVEAGDILAARREWLRLATSGLAPVRARIEAGLLAEEIGNHDVAERDYRAATARATGREERAEALAVLSRFFVRRGDPKRALDLLRAAAKKYSHPLLPVAIAYIESRMTGDPTALARHRRTLEKKEKTVPLYGYFLGFLNLWDGRPIEGLKALRGFVSRGIDQATGWGRELAPELDHARRTILQVDAMARVPMP